MTEEPFFWECLIQFTYGFIGGIIGASLSRWQMERKKKNQITSQPEVITAHFLR
jgi:hypothetical protein